MKAEWRGRAPAKVNLFLEVMGLRKDGYHNIETVMQTVSLYDDIKLFEIEKAIKIICDSDSVPNGRENTAYNAAESFFNAACTGDKQGIVIEINKSIPAGAGLGGGSSDAAAVLRGLNEMNGNILDFDHLVKLAAEVGSDVPFFLYGGTALCRGRGEIIEPLDVGSREYWYVIVVPPVNMSTASVYARFEKDGLYPDPPKNSSDFTEDFGGRDLKLFNRLEDAAFAENPELRCVRDRISGGDYQLTGSGSGFFKLFSSEQECKDEINRLENCSQLSNCDVYFCRGD